MPAANRLHPVKRHDSLDIPDLSSVLQALVVAHFRFPVRLANRHVERAATRLGLREGDDFAIVHVRVGETNAALAAVPSRHWRDKDTMRLFYQLKAEATSEGESLILIPEGFLRREPRCSNALMVASTRRTAMRLVDRMAVLEHLIEFNSASLSELGSLVVHPDPISAVLSLCVEGLLDIDLDRPILPSSTVSLGEVR